MNENNIPIIIQLPEATHQQQSLESSLQSLIKTYLRRQKWRNYFCSNADDKKTIITTPPNRRSKLANLLESKISHSLTISLLFVDLTLTTLELTSSLISCTSSNVQKRQENQKTTAWYHWLGIAILGLLLARTATLVAALGWPAVARRPGLIVDAFVLVGALFLETFLEGKGGGLVAVASLWRVVRVIESAFELGDDVIEEKIEGIEAQLEGLREENLRLVEDVYEKGRVIEKLQDDLDKCKYDF